MKTDFTGTRKHTVYFFMVFDCIRNLEDMLKEKARSGDGRANPIELFKDFADRKIVCNYEYVRN